MMGEKNLPRCRMCFTKAKAGKGGPRIPVAMKLAVFSHPE